LRTLNLRGVAVTPPQAGQTRRLLDEAETDALASDLATPSKETPVANQSKQQSREELNRLVKEALKRGSVG
jgi:hypothetical protein